MTHSKKSNFAFSWFDKDCACKKQKKKKCYEYESDDDEEVVYCKTYKKHYPIVTTTSCCPKVQSSVCTSRVCCPVQKCPPCPTGPPGPPGPTGAGAQVQCVDFFAPQAAIAGTTGIAAGGFTALFGGIFTALFGATVAAGLTTVTGAVTAALGTLFPAGVAAGAAASIASPSGTVIPTAGMQGCNVGPEASPIVYDPATNSFVVCKEGAYEITYYLQGVFQGPVPEGISFAVFANGIPIPQSVVTVATGLLDATGGAFNVTKKFCVLLPAILPLEASPFLCCPSNAPVRLQVRVLEDFTNPTAIAPLSLLFPIIGVIGGTAVAGAAGTLLPDNAFEIVFDRLGDIACPTASKKQCACACNGTGAINGGLNGSASAFASSGLLGGIIGGGIL